MALYVATILGDLGSDVVIVGGLVPYLIVDQERAPERHVGTRDLDLGLSRAVPVEDHPAPRLRGRQAGGAGRGAHQIDVGERLAAPLGWLDVAPLDRHGSLWL
ncbi:MAG: hypothetical protein JXB39_15665, partial [Deltaproteobacteria bacterium]|nr:hypothetical protein [Deltaproteobacteria bacterium]